MSIIHDYLYDKWNEDGVVESLDDIQTALEHRISYEEATEVPFVVQSFIRTICKEEGVILFETTEKP